MENKENSSMYLNTRPNKKCCGKLLKVQIPILSDESDLFQFNGLVSEEVLALKIKRPKLSLKKISLSDYQCPACDKLFIDPYKHLLFCRSRKTAEKDKSKKIRKFIESNFNRLSKNQNYIRIHRDVSIKALLEFQYTDDIVSDTIEIEDNPVEYCDCNKCTTQCLCFDKTNFAERGTWFECNRNCSCINETCITKVIQNGSEVSLEIFQTEEKGHGVRALQKIPSKTFIDIYSGDIITIQEAFDESKKGNCYLWDLDIDEPRYTMNAKYKGNISRFINHSCKPNVMIVFGFINCLDIYRPLIAFFSKKVIKKNEELTVDYQMPKPFGANYCSCKTHACRNPERKKLNR